ncbi:MAG: hypothetical protein OEM05_01270 [Myxococcales bacterium]|nr:hypothetical protein [Myxococcales bacterium]
MLLAAACAGFGVHTAPPPSAAERYCAWYGDARGGTLYFGQAAFWSAFHGPGAGPRADLARAGPAMIGRFNLARERLLEPLDVSAGGDRSGIWDVLAHDNGRLYFTSYFESAGWVDPATGVTRRLASLGPGLNELAHGPNGTLLASRYVEAGSVVHFGAEGTLLAEHPLRAPPGFAALPKTVAFDPSRGEIWVTTDLLPAAAGSAARHDAYVLDAAGRELRRIETPEIQFVAFAEDGTGYRAEVESRRLALRIVPPAPADADGGRLVPLDDDFPTQLDFVQDIQMHPDGRAVVARWSGRVHVVGPELRVRSLRLPALEPGGLYYTAALSDGRVCATYCAGVTVVCRDLP